MECINNPPHILLAEDDEEMRKTLSSVLRAQGYLVFECWDGLDLLKVYATSKPQTHKPGYSLLISDIRMPGLSGMEFLEGFYDKQGFPPIILITAFGDDETHARARKLGAVAILDKPFDIEDLLAVVSKVVSQSVQPHRTCETNTAGRPEGSLAPGEFPSASH